MNSIAKIEINYTWILYFILSYVSSFYLSGISEPYLQLDSSYQAVLEYTRTKEFQFGKDIVFTYGPIGFLNTEVSQGFFSLLRMFFALAWSGIVAYSVTVLSQQMSKYLRYLFIVWVVFYSNSGGLGQHAFLVLFVGSMILTDDIFRSKIATLLFITSFVLLALIKFTFFIAVLVAISICIIVQLSKKHSIESYAITLLFLTTFLLMWLLNSQKISYLLPWIRGSFEISSGYTDAMSIFPKIDVLSICALATLIFFACACNIFYKVWLEPRNIGLLSIALVYLFLAWKHGFVRADGHVLGYIFMFPLIFSVLLIDLFQRKLQEWQQKFVALCFVVIILLCNWAADLQEPGIMLTKIVDWPRYMVNNAKLIYYSATANAERCFAALNREQQYKKAPDLPFVRSVVGNAPVDLINFSQWAILANGLNYRPRPVIQGYSAYNNYLQGLNLTFYQSEKRPEFVLLRLETIDGRFPTLDDASLLPYILDNYSLIAEEDGFLVLKFFEKLDWSTKYSLINEKKLGFGKDLEVPCDGNSPILMQVDILPNAWGRISSFLFQSPTITLHITTAGKKAGYRFIPAMAQSGFVVSPLLLTTRDVKRYFEGAPGNCADNISFSLPHYAKRLHDATITVKFYKKLTMIKDPL